VTDKIPKLEFAELPASIAAALAPKYQRLGYLGEFFARTAHQEAALKAFIEFTDAAKGALDMRVVELIALTVSVMKGVAYERNQHERLSVNLGFGRDWVAEVERLAPEQARITDIERTVQRFVIDAVNCDGRGVTPQLDAVVDTLGRDDAVAVMMVMARYTTHALLVNCLAIEPPVPSIFVDGYAGNVSARKST
jgi:alkylhydroperoxidase family enzyme